MPTSVRMNVRVVGETKVLGVMGGGGGVGGRWYVEIADFIQNNRRAIQMPRRESRDAVLHYSGFAAGQVEEIYGLLGKNELKEKRTRNQQRSYSIVGKITPFRFNER